MSACDRMQPRKEKNVRIRLDLCQWAEERVKEGRFWNFSHAIEFALITLRDIEKEGARET